jgi:putative ABC transport system permease protein
MFGIRCCSRFVRCAAMPRSALTMLGIVIGRGRDRDRDAGARRVSASHVRCVEPRRPLAVREPRVGQRRPARCRDPSVTDRDVAAISRDVRGVDAVSPTAGSTVTAVYGNSHWSVTVTGITASYFSVRNAVVARGASSRARIKAAGSPASSARPCARSCSAPDPSVRRFV